MELGKSCEKCFFRRHAERKPKSLLARLWRWHTTWCPGWKANQELLAGQATETTTPSSPITRPESYCSSGDKQEED